jgi:hypothetical protein
MRGARRPQRGFGLAAAAARAAGTMTFASRQGARAASAIQAAVRLGDLHPTLECLHGTGLVKGALRASHATGQARPLTSPAPSK